ncbi:MAG: sodium:proline symporter, partial [Peptococcaceae bacterium]|nr:sodium:proline symporter [Peptococcaceae bacterium]
VMIGPAAHVYLAEPLAAGQHETVFMVLVNQMFHPIITGVLLSAILAAIMSTASAQLLVTASSLSNDLYRGFVRKNASEKEVIWVSKFTVLLVAALALYMGMDPNSSIFGIVSYAWAGLGASFGPAVFLSLYWKRMTCKGAIAGVVTGAVSTIVFNWLKLNVGGIFSVYELLPAFICAIIAIVVVSLLDKEPEKAIQDDFDKALDYAKNN